MTVTQLIIQQHAQKRQRKLTDAQIEYFQAREGIRTFPSLADAIIGGFARSYPSEITFLNYLREISDEQTTQHTQELDNVA